MSFFTLGARDRIGKEHHLLKLSRLINWSLLEKNLRGIHVNEQNSKGGPKAYSNLSMFKALLDFLRNSPWSSNGSFCISFLPAILAYSLSMSKTTGKKSAQKSLICQLTLNYARSLLLGQWHSLSDPGLEEALRVRLDFMMFTGFEIGDTVPDETTLCRFRNKLIEKGLLTVLFTEINRQLEEHGIKVREAEAALVDATIIISSARPRQAIEEDGNIKQSADRDASWVKKGKKRIILLTRTRGMNLACQ